MLFAIISYSQIYQLEENPNWVKYSKVIEINPEFKDSREEFILENGKVIQVKNFIKDSLTYSQTLVYDKHGNVSMVIRDLQNDTINLNNQYFNDLLDSDKYYYYTYNEKGKLTHKTSGNVFLELGEGFYYNENGTINKAISINRTSNDETYRINTLYKYNKCNNVIEHKSVKEKIKFPIVNTELDFENATITQYHYKYNNGNCIWTKKYLIENGKKKLISTRILIKSN